MARRWHRHWFGLWPSYCVLHFEFHLQSPIERCLVARLKVQENEFYIHSNEFKLPSTNGILIEGIVQGISISKRLLLLPNSIGWLNRLQLSLRLCIEIPRAHVSNTWRFQCYARSKTVIFTSRWIRANFRFDSHFLFLRIFLAVIFHFSFFINSVAHSQMLQFIVVIGGTGV